MASDRSKSQAKECRIDGSRGNVERDPARGGAGFLPDPSEKRQDRRRVVSVWSLLLCLKSRRERGSLHSAYTNTGTMQRRLAWPPCKDDPQIREALPIFKEVQMGS